MKDKFKNISNNLKNFKNNINKNKSIKFILITTLIALSVYLLYFNDKIFVQDIIVNSLNEEKDDKESIIENFNVAKYVDICKNRKTNFYNVSLPSGITLNTIETSNCELKCDIEDCDAFIMQDIIESENKKCITYKGNVDSSGIDQNDISINVNCSSTILPEDKYGTYIGYGYINKKYFENNKKDKFKYADAYLQESNSILSKFNELKDLNDRSNKLDLNNENNKIIYGNLRSNIITKYNDLINNINNINNKFFNIDKNILFTDMFKSQGIDNNNVLIPNYRDMSFVNDINNKYNSHLNSDTLDNKLDSINKKSYTNYMLHIFLAFIMVITVILLFLYKLSNNIVNEQFIITYFIIITIVLFLINNYIKI